MLCTTAINTSNTISNIINAVRGCVKVVHRRNFPWAMVATASGVKLFIPAFSTPRAQVCREYERAGRLCAVKTM